MRTRTVVAGVFAAFGAAAAAVTQEEATAEGVAYFAGRCKEQQGLLVDLQDALATGDIEASKTAYIASRPPYEEIEVLATADSIGPLDGAIDARPYAFDGGEDNSDFQGFHRVERDLYRDEDIDAAKENLKPLIASVDELCQVLDAGGDVTPQNSLDGQLALAYELSAKKYSSEEETWSDASLMIYRHNWIGIYSQFAPFKKAGLDEAIAKKVDDSYANVQEVYNSVDPAGFNASNGESRSYADVSTEERNKLVIVAGYEFAEAIKEAHTALYEPLETEEEEEDDAAVIAEGAYQEETAAGIASLRELCTAQQVSLKDLMKAVDSGDIDQARGKYAAARLEYEQIEVVAGAFEDEDGAIDARPDAYEFGERDDGWKGMHAVERQLYRDNDLEAAKSSLLEVEEAVTSLCTKLGDSELYGADTAFKGMLALSQEVPAKKISSEEETVSDLSFMIFRENSKGIKAIYTPFKPLLSNETLDRVDKAFDSIKAYWENELDKDNDWATGTSFRAYSDVDNSQRRGIHTRFMELYRGLQVAQSEVAAEAPAPEAATAEPNAEDDLHVSRPPPRYCLPLVRSV